MQHRDNKLLNGSEEYGTGVVGGILTYISLYCCHVAPLEALTSTSRLMIASTVVTADCLIRP